MEYYDWSKTRSYDAIVTMVVGPRGLGKTYGCRKSAISDYLRYGRRFVELCRYQDELPLISAGYFDRVGNEFPGKVFKTEGGRGYIADESDEPKWEPLCYFSALTAGQKDKKRTFDNVGAIIFDEFLIDRKLNPYMRYLPNEVDSLYNAYSTFTRETPGVKNYGRLYLLGNATDLANPYFMRWNVKELPEVNSYRWYNGKTVLLHYCAPQTYAESVAEMTNIGRLINGEAQGSLMFESKFLDSESDFIERRPSRARFDYALTIEGLEFAVWRDPFTHVAYLCYDVPNNATARYTVTKNDLTESRTYATRASDVIKSLVGEYTGKNVRFETPTIKILFNQAVGSLGVR